MNNRKLTDDHLKSLLSESLSRATGWAQGEHGEQVLADVLASSSTAEAGKREEVTVHRRLGSAHRRRALVLALVAISALTALFAGLLPAVQDDEQARSVATPSPEEPSDDESFEAAKQQISGSRPPGYMFDNLPQLVANSAVVVSGVVVNEAPGEYLGDYRMLTARDLRLRVDSVFKGDRVSSGSGLTFHGGYIINDQVLPIPEQELIGVGDYVVAFLAPRTNSVDTHYTVVAVPGLWKIDDSERVTVYGIDAVADRLSGNSWTAVQEELVRAVKRAEEQGIKPLPGGPPLRPGRTD